MHGKRKGGWWGGEARLVFVFKTQKNNGDKSLKAETIGLRNLPLPNSTVNLQYLCLLSAVWARHINPAKVSAAQHSSMHAITCAEKFKGHPSLITRSHHTHHPSPLDGRGLHARVLFSSLQGNSWQLLATRCKLSWQEQCWGKMWAGPLGGPPQFQAARGKGSHGKT